jgi:hypothetical protein
MDRLELIKEILKLNKCCCCGLEYISLNPIYDDICPTCDKELECEANLIDELSA